VTKRLRVLSCCLLTVRTELSQLSNEWFADPNAIAFSFPGDAAEQRAGRVMGANDKLHQRTKTPNGWRPDKVQSGYGGFKSFLEPRISLETTYGLP